MTTTDPTIAPTATSTTTVLDPGPDAGRILESFALLTGMDVATSIKQAARCDADLLADSVSPDYIPDDADVAVEGADPIMVAELNAILLYLAQHGPAVAFASRMMHRIMDKIDRAVDATLGPDVEEAVTDGLRVNQRLRAAWSLLDQVRDAHPEI